MKHFPIAPLVFFAGLTLAVPFLSAETRDLNFSGFTGVSVGWGMEVDITQGPDFRVQVTGDSRDLEELRVEKEGDVLTFSHKSRWGGWNRHGKVSANIVMPALTSLDLSGGSEGRITMDVASKSFSADLSGGSELNGQLRCGDIKLVLSGGSELHLSGQGGNLSIDGSGGSTCDAREFEARNVDSELSGGSTATINMNGELNASQSGGSEIIYYGNATLGQTDSSGGSRIRKGN
ncbi:MAG: head GIN domain-containing protein [Acidobacteriota bacterium]